VELISIEECFLYKGTKRYNTIFIRLKNNYWEWLDSVPILLVAVTYSLS